MQTRLGTDENEVIIDIDGPFVIIGEKINPTGRKKLAQALRDGDFEYVRELARKQVTAGADILDVNVGVPGLDEVLLLPKAIEMVTSAVAVPICLDSANHKALAAGLAVTPGKDHDAAVIGLTMDDDGIPNDVDVRVAIAGKILERAAKVGIPAEDVVIDPLVLTVGADSDAGVITLQTIERIQREFGVNINLGASNVSFGLPDRHTVNQAFLALAAAAGATCAITDPMKLTGTIRAIDLLRGHDSYGGRYIKHFRSQQQKRA
jgi:5-methyltetrahydrofolate--homocysteine methyltransferase